VACTVIHVHADDIRGHQVGSALDALEVAAERAGECLAQQRLAEAWHALDQHVAAGDDRNAERVHDGLQADGSRADGLLQSLLE